MSVINQMLKDLEQRRSGDFEGKGSILDDLDAGSSNAVRHWGMKLILLLLIISMMLLAWLLWDRFTQVPAQASSAVIQKSVTQAPAPVKPIIPVMTSDTEFVPQDDIKQNKEAERTVVPEAETITPEKQIDKPAVNISAGIESITPERIMATGKRTVMHVYGEGFIAPFEVLLEWSDGRAFKVLDEWQVELINEREMHLHFNPGTQADKWSIRVERHGGASSERFTFNVYAVENEIKKEVSSAGPETEQKSLVSKIRRQVDPAEKAASLFVRASALLRDRQLAEAEKVLQKILSLDAEHSQARKLLASLLFQDKQHIAAAEMLEAGISQQPGYIPFSLLLARVRMEQGRDTDAIKVLEGQRPLARDNSDYYALLAALYQRAGRYSDAAKVYRGLVDVFPRRAVWWMGLGISMQSLDKPEEALAAYKQALKSQGLQSDLKKFVQQRIQLLGG